MLADAVDGRVNPHRPRRSRWLPVLMLPLLAGLAGGALWTTGRLVDQADPQALMRATVRTTLNVALGYQSIERFSEAPDPPFEVAASTEGAVLHVEGRTGLPDGCEVDIQVRNDGPIRSTSAVTSAGRFTADMSLAGLTTGSYDVFATFEVLDESTAPKEVLRRWPGYAFHGPAPGSVPTLANPSSSRPRPSA